jgi:hypothetical protein
MPRPKPINDDIHKGESDVFDPEAENALNDAVAKTPHVRDLQALLATIGTLISVRDGNGKQTRKFCLLCKEARRLRIPCPHTQIWATP